MSQERLKWIKLEKVGDSVEGISAGIINTMNGLSLKLKIGEEVVGFSPNVVLIKLLKVNKDVVNTLATKQVPVKIVFKSLSTKKTKGNFAKIFQLFVDGEEIRDNFFCDLTTEQVLELL